MRTSINLPAEAPLAPSSSFEVGWGRPALALAPDGSALVYVALTEDTRQLYRRDMRSGAVAPLPGTEDAQGPFFSPDGRWVAFFAARKLAKVLLAGGEPQVIGDARWGHGGVWGADGFLYFCPDEGQGIHRVRAEGGAVERMTEPGGGFMHAWPALIADGGPLLVTRLPRLQRPAATRAGEPQHSIGLAGFGRREPPPILVERGSFARYAPTGHLVFARAELLLASRYDRTAGRTAGSASVLLDDLRSEPRGAAQVTWSDEGTLVYAPRSHVASEGFLWVDRHGGREPVGLPGASWGSFAISPDGSSLAYTGPEGRLWSYDLKRRGAPQLLTPTAQEPGRSCCNGGVWAENGAGLYATGRTSRGSAIFFVPTTDVGREPLEVIPAEAARPDLAADGLVYDAGGDIAYVPYGDQPGTVDLDRRRDVISSPGTIESFPVVSPDGRWLAYMSDESGGWEIYVTRFPEATTRRRVSFAGGEEPRWSPDGSEILYRFGPRWFSVSFVGEPELNLGRPQLLFEGPYVNVPGYSWDVSPDGQRFLVIEDPDAGHRLTELVVVSHFFDELRRRLPAE